MGEEWRDWLAWVAGVCCVLLIVFVGWLPLSTGPLWALRTGVGIIGFTGLRTYWRHRENRLSEGGAAAAAQAKGGSDVARSLETAQQKILEKTAGEGNLRNRPVVLLAGRVKSGKTSIMQYGGLRSEVVAGRPPDNYVYVPTESLNAWFNRDVVLLEAGGPMLSNPAAWDELAAALAPPTLRSLFPVRQPLRAVVVVVSCEGIGREDAASRLRVAAKELRTPLERLSSRLGMRLPVHVLFTQVDRVNNCKEFYRHITPDEARQIFGAALTPEQIADAERDEQTQAKMLEARYADIYHRLCDDRVKYLPREKVDTSLVRRAYEFPRVFLKLQPAVTAFLTQLFLPTQTATGLTLSGFYFSGASAGPCSLSPTPAAGAVTPGRTPEGEEPKTTYMANSSQVDWRFLENLLTNILESVRRVAVRSRRVVSGRRILLAAIAVLLGVVSSFVGGSYHENAARINDLAGASKATGSAAQNLRSLDRLRQMTIPSGTSGHWFDLDHWGFDTGPERTAVARKMYLRKRFRTELLTPFFEGLRKRLNDGTAAYDPTYQALEALLIVARENRRSVTGKLSALAPDVIPGYTAGEERELVRRQFEFYEKALQEDPSLRFGDADDPIVSRARQRLLDTFSPEVGYARLKNGPPPAPELRWPDETVPNKRIVAGLFTAEGRLAVEKTPLPRGEAWVLGRALPDTAAIRLAIRDFYRKDAIEEWKEFLTNASVATFNDRGQAQVRLTELASPRSPLFALLCRVDQGTDGYTEFDAIHSLAPCGTGETGSGDPAGTYRAQLNKLAEQVGMQPPQGTCAVALSAAAEAAKGLTPTLDGPRKSNATVLRRLLLRPSELSSRFCRPQEAIDAAQKFCSANGSLFAKYPFRATSAEVTPDEVRRLIDSWAAVRQTIDQDKAFHTWAMKMDQFSKAFPGGKLKVKITFKGPQELPIYYYLRLGNRDPRINDTEALDFDLPLNEPATVLLEERVGGQQTYKFLDAPKGYWSLLRLIEDKRGSDAGVSRVSFWKYSVSGQRQGDPLVLTISPAILVSIRANLPTQCVSQGAP